MDISTLSLNIYLATIPSVILLIYVYQKDIVEKEPMKLLIRLFFLGIIISVPISFLEQSVISATGISAINFFDSFILSFFVVGLIEEGYKYIVVLIGSWKNDNFNHKYDAIVYSVFVSIGFATIENILYVIKSYNEASLLTSNTFAAIPYQVAIFRGIMSVPAHAFYAVACGFFLGLAKENSHKNNKKNKYIFLLLSFAVPWILHSIFDFLLLTENGVLLGVFFSFVATLYVVSYYQIKKTHNGKMLKK